MKFLFRSKALKSLYAIRAQLNMIKATDTFISSDNCGTLSNVIHAENIVNRLRNLLKANQSFMNASFSCTILHSLKCINSQLVNVELNNDYGSFLTSKNWLNEIINAFKDVSSTNIIDVK